MPARIVVNRMAGSPHPVYAEDEQYRGYLPPDAWTLCLGAGVSKGIAPEWDELAHGVVSETFGLSISKTEFDGLVGKSGWSLDSWIQAAANEHMAKGRSPESFKELIEFHLYSKIRAKANGLGVERYLIKVLNSPKSEPKDRVIEVCGLIESEFSGSSLVQVANVLIEAAKTGRRPKAVLTFNADTFLETYIDLRLRRDHYLGPGPHSHPVYYFAQVTRPSITSGQKIPIVHCHGCVAPMWEKGKIPRDSRDRMVFLEQEYLAMANSGGSWAETLFLFHAQTAKMAFVGLSMSDSNIRRWMSASNIERAKDREVYGYTDRPNPDHIWVRPAPDSDSFKKLYLSSLQHLGVRPAWITSWGHLETGLRNLAAIPSMT